MNYYSGAHIDRLARATRKIRHGNVGKHESLIGKCEGKNSRGTEETRAL